MTIRRRGRTGIGVAVVALVIASCSTGGSERAGGPTTTIAAPTGPTTTGPLGSEARPLPDELRIQVLSSQPDRVSGDDARVRVTPPAGSSPSDLRVFLGDTEVTASLRVVDDGLEGVLDGLIEGNNTLRATAGSDEAIARIRAWPLTGPMFSGPHLPLLACSTEDHGLGPPTDADCSAPTQVTWKYVDEEGTLRTLEDPSVEPSDIGTATVDGEQVPFYVRYESGVINRSVYEVASVDPTPTDDDPTGAGWNRALLYRFGGGCGTTYGQGSSATSAEAPVYLAQGYVVATATFNTFAVQCNDVLSAETMMMVKERVIELFGIPDLTIGEGASGGAIQLHLIAQNYPGLINGAVAALPFPDAISIAPGVTDCGLLLDHYASPTGRDLTAAQRRAVNGHASPETCTSWARTFLAGIDPTRGCDPKIPAEDIYDPRSNRTGVRCTLQDANRNQFGIDETTGWAARPLDNVGVQYGLQALNDGIISIDQFLDLNEAVGGYDLDGTIVDARHEADPEAVLRAYETGRVAMGGGDLLNIPIIDLNLFTDQTGDIHDRFRAFSLRDRLVGAGSADDAPGFQIWTRDPATADLTRLLADSLAGGSDAVGAVAVVHEWLLALRADRGGDELAEVLRRTRPAAGLDNCVPDGATEPLGGLDIYEQAGPCRDDHPISGDPRTAAGAPRSNQVLKCALKLVDPRDYEIGFSPDQLDRLEDVFPQGVCDWDRPSVGEIVPAAPDRTYEDVVVPAQDA